MGCQSGCQWGAKPWVDRYAVVVGCLSSDTENRLFPPVFSGTPGDVSRHRRTTGSFHGMQEVRGSKSSQLHSTTPNHFLGIGVQTQPKKETSLGIWVPATVLFFVCGSGSVGDRSASDGRVLSRALPTISGEQTNDSAKLDDRARPTPAHEIIEAARNEACDLIVIGHGGIRRGWASPSGASVSGSFTMPLIQCWFPAGVVLYRPRIPNRCLPAAPQPSRRLRW